MRLVTRGDLDGLTSAVIITMKEPIDAIALVHPQDITDKTVEIRSDDILANLPYHPRCGLGFSPPLVPQRNGKPPGNFQGRDGPRAWGAGAVYEDYRERDPDDEALGR